MTTKTTSPAKVSAQAATLANPRTAGSIDPTDAAEIPTPPPPQTWTEQVEAAFAGRTAAPLAQLLLALGADLEDLKPLVALLRDGLTGTQGDQEDLADAVHRRMTSMKKQISDLKQDRAELVRRVEHLEAAYDLPAGLKAAASTVQVANPWPSEPSLTSHEA